MPLARFCPRRATIPCVLAVDMVCLARRGTGCVWGMVEGSRSMCVCMIAWTMEHKHTSTKSCTCLLKLCRLALKKKALKTMAHEPKKRKMMDDCHM